MQDARLLADGPEAFAEDDEFVARDVEFLNRFADQFLADAVGVDVRSVPGIEAAVWGLSVCEKYMATFAASRSIERILATYRKRLSTASSLRLHR